MKLAILAVSIVIFASSISCSTEVCAATVRNPAQAAAFRKVTPCPATGKIQRWCKGYVADHVIPLCAGGPDVPSNMQWQERQASYKKDVLERKQCAVLRKQRK